VPDVVTLGKGFGNGFPSPAVAVREPYKEASRRSPPPAATAATPWPAPRRWPRIEVIEEENLLERARTWANLAMKRMKRR
jgi:4-aminobutyrate aminotransferase-like enzyme